MRLCKYCGQPLSSYNKGHYCFCHTPGQLLYKHIPITCFTSYAASAAAVPQAVPGHEDYLEFAFEPVLVGVVGSDHTPKSIIEEE